MKKNKSAQALAKKRHLSLSPERRSEIATLAAKARWENKGEKVINTPRPEGLALPNTCASM